MSMSGPRRPPPDAAGVTICPSPLRNLSLVSRVANSPRRRPREAGEASSNQIITKDKEATCRSR